MRAPGEASGSFALESALDELAYRLGMDPVELRLKNDARTAPGRDNPWSSKHLDECYRVGVREFGWPGRPRAARAMRDGDWWVGTGMATGVYPAFRHDATARVRLHQDGTVDVEADTADLGTGMTTVLAVVGADALGLPVQRVRGRLGDSALPSSGYIGGSCGTATVGSAILAAAQLAQRQLLTLAAGNPQSPLHGVPNAELRYENGQLSGRGRTVTFGALLRATGTPEVAATGTAAPGAEAEQYEMDCFTANFCEVRVHRLTGEARVSRMLGVVDAGRIVNPKTARNQIVGGMVWGVSAALHEGLNFEASGRLANGNLAEYLLPVNADVPEVDVHFLDYPDTIHNPLGAKGIGELGIVGMAAAVANAVHHATGKRIRDLPITLEQLLD
jgi:xanthine dehydrogenase YagR molybdenum-binding subunit